MSVVFGAASAVVIAAHSSQHPAGSTQVKVLPAVKPPKAAKPRRERGRWPWGRGRKEGAR